MYQLTFPLLHYNSPLSCIKNRLCIGEKKGNVAYLYIYFEKGIYYLVGYPDAGRDDHLPKLKIRDQDWRRRKLQEANGNDAERELWGKSYFPPSKDVIVRFRDGPGDINSLWQIFSNGFSKTSPYARWYLVSKAPRTCDDVVCPDGETCDPADLTCKDEDQFVPCISVIDEDDSFSFGSPCGNQEECWAEFRAEYPLRPFCLIGITPSVIGVPPNFEADSEAIYVEDVPRDCDRSGQNCAAAQDWLSLCGYDNIQASTVEFLGLFVDNSGSMTQVEVQPSIDLLTSNLNNKGISISEVVNTNENWIAPFLTSLVPTNP